MRAGRIRLALHRCLADHRAETGTAVAGDNPRDSTRPSASTPRCNLLLLGGLGVQDMKYRYTRYTPCLHKYSPDSGITKISPSRLISISNIVSIRSMLKNGHISRLFRTPTSSRRLVTLASTMKTSRNAIRALKLVVIR